MNNLLSSIASWWGGLPSSRKSMYVVLVGTLLAAAIFFAQWAGRVTYAPLFTNLDTKDAGGVVAKLKEMRVPYKIVDQGATIMVPEEQVYDLQIQLVGSGMLVGSGVGFEFLDKTKLGMTEFEQNMNYLRALQEELRRTIVRFEEVSDARVHIVLPQDSLFTDKARPASAAVTLTLKPFIKINPEQVKAIVFLVASAVENLPPENVKVIDTKGAILSELVAQGTVGSAGQRQVQQELKREFEKDIEHRVQAMLERVLGAGKAVVMVTAELDFDQKERSVITYTDPGVVRTEQTKQSTGSSTGGSAGPVGDPNRDVPGYPAAGAESQSNFDNNEAIRTYELSQTQERTVEAPGKLKSLSTSVSVDGNLTQPEVDQVRAMVAAATGYQSNRDQISVVSMAFNNAAQVEAEKAMADAAETSRKQGRMRQYINWGLQGFGALLAFFAVLILLRRFSRRYVAPIAMEAEIAGPIPLEGLGPGYVPPPLSQEEHERREKQQHVKDLARQKPEEVAQLLKAWLAED